MASICYSDDYLDGLDGGSLSTAANDKQGLAKTETKAVRQVKALVLAVLTVSALAASAVVYLYVTGSERTEFETTFHDDATKLLASFGTSLEKTLSSADAFAVSVVSHAKASGQQWPYVTIPDFAIRAGKVRDSTNAFIVNLYMYVKEEERLMWENFTANPANNYWMDESIEIQANNPDYKGPITRNYTNFNVIHGYDEFDKENAGEFGTDKDGPYLVWWQCYPVVAYDPVRMILAAPESFAWSTHTNLLTTSLAGLQLGSVHILHLRRFPRDCISGKEDNCP
jgi:hypothetical protein